MVILMLTDTHCHFEKEYYDDYNQILKNAKDNGVNRIIACGCSLYANNEAVTLSNNEENVYSTIGYHPDQADTH